MTRKEMMQAYYIHEEILMWQKRLKDLRESCGVGSPGFEKKGKAKKASDPTGDIGAERAEIEKLISSKIKHLKKIEKEIIAYIVSLDDSVMRQICLYRCIDFKSWQAVANKIGGGNTCDSVRKKFNREFP